MGFIQTVLLGAGLSMDSFALSVTNGMCAVKNRILTAIMSAFCFGLFQGSLTTLGYTVGSAFADKIKMLDHYIALVLLCYIGAKLIIGSRQSKDEQVGALSPAMVFVSAFTTSVDALTVGVSLAALEVKIVYVAAVMTLVSTAICFAGFLLGKKAGERLGSSAQVIGGLVLIGLGIKIFVQHMFF